MTDSVVGMPYRSQTAFISTSPEYSGPGNSAREAKPSPSTWTIIRRRPFSVVTSGIGISGSTSARRRNSSGWITQRDCSIVPNENTAYGLST